MTKFPACLLVTAVLLALTPLAQAEIQMEPQRLHSGEAAQFNLTLDRARAGLAVLLEPRGPRIANRHGFNLPVHALARHGDNVWVATETGVRGFSIANRSQLTETGFLPLDKPQRVAATATRLVAVDRNGLNIADCTDPAAPRLLARIRLAQEVTHLVAADDAVYVVLNNRLLARLVPTAKKPRLQILASASQPVQAVAMEGRNLWLAQGNAGVTVYGVTGKKRITLTRLGRYATSAAAVDIAATDGQVHVALGEGGELTLDGSNPKQPRWLGSHQRLGHVTAVRSGMATSLAANRDGTLYWLDHANPAQPTVMAALALDPVRTIDIVDEQALALTASELVLLDFSAEPPALSNELLNFGQGVNFGGERRVFIADNLAYVADWFSGIHIYDIRTPARPRLLSSFHTPGSPKGIVVRDGLAYVADDDHGLQVIDVHDPRAPQLVATLPTAGLAYTPRLVGNTLYLASHRGGFQIIDVSTPAEPRLLGEFDTPGKAWSMEVRGNYAYVADDESGVLIFNIADASAPRLVGQYNPGGAAEEILLRDGIAYVAFYNDGLHIIDIKNPKQPRRIARLPLAGNARGLDRVGNTLYVAAWLAGVHVVDVRNPRAPRLRSSFDTRGATWGVKANGKQLYAMDWWGGFVVLDAGKPDRLRPLASYHQRGRTRAIASRDNRAYVAQGDNGLQVYDITNPLYPTWMTGVDIPGDARAVALDGDLALVATDTGLAVVDITNPYQARLRATLKLDRPALRIVAAGRRAYVLDAAGGVTVIDARDPAAPIAGSRADLAARDLWLGTDELYVATATGISLYSTASAALDTPVRNMAIAGGIANLRGQGDDIYIVLNDAIERRSRADGSLRARWTAGDIITAFDVHADLLYLAIGRQLIALDAQTLQPLSRLSLLNPVTGLSLTERAVFVSGSDLPVAVQLLPRIKSEPVDGTTLSIRLPADLPVGNYDVVVRDGDGIEQRILNGVSVAMKRFGKPNLTLEQFEKLKEEQKNTDVFISPK